MIYFNDDDDFVENGRRGIAPATPSKSATAGLAK